MEKSIEERITDLERRFRPIERTLYESEFKDIIEKNKRMEYQSNGKTFIVTVQFQTDKGDYTKHFDILAYTEKQACYLCDVDVLKPNLDKLKQSNVIKWYKVNNKTANLK